MSKKEENVIFLSAREITVHNQAAVHLTWDYDHFDGLFHFQIYRSVDGTPLTAYAVTNSRDGVTCFCVVLIQTGVYGMGNVLPK